MHRIYYRGDRIDEETLPRGGGEFYRKPAIDDGFCVRVTIGSVQNYPVLMLPRVIPFNRKVQPFVFSPDFDAVFFRALTQVINPWCMKADMYRESTPGRYNVERPRRWIFGF